MVKAAKAPIRIRNSAVHDAKMATSPVNNIIQPPKEPEGPSSLSRRWVSVGYMVQGSGYMVQGSGFRVQGTGFRVQGSGYRVQGTGRKRA